MIWPSTSPSLLHQMRDLENEQAWREFDERYGERILRYALVKGVSLTDAEDVRQNVFVSLARRFPTFQYKVRSGRFRDYLGTVVRHAIIRQATRRQHQVEVQRSDFEENPRTSLATTVTGSDDEAWNREWVHHHIRLALEAVRSQSSERSMSVFVTLLQGRSVDETAEMHRITSAAVYKIKQRLTRRMRAQVARQMKEEGG